MNVVRLFYYLQMIVRDLSTLGIITISDTILLRKCINVPTPFCGWEGSSYFCSSFCSSTQGLGKPLFPPGCRSRITSGLVKAENKKAFSSCLLKLTFVIVFNSYSYKY